MIDIAQFDRSGDFRGDYPRCINEEFAYCIGHLLIRRLIAWQLEPTVLVARDGRLFSFSLYRTMIEGIRAAGGAVVPIGLASTDTLAWATGTSWGHAVAAAVVTCSHNRDPRDHGVKFLVRRGQTVQAIQPARDLRPLLDELDEDESAFSVRNPGELLPPPFVCSLKTSVQQMFVDHACSFAPDRRQFANQIVFDAGNGVAGLFVPSLRRNLPDTAIECMGMTIDGTFPERGPDPSSARSSAALCKRVVACGADFGVAFDGDADRAFLVDEHGAFISGHRLAAVLADMVLDQAQPDGAGPVVFASPSSWQIVEVARKYSVPPVIAKVGQETIKHAMQAVDAVLGLEPSGHFNFARSFNQDSGLIGLMYFWQALHDRQLTASQLVENVNSGGWTQTGDINIRVENLDLSANGDRLLDLIGRRYEGSEADGYLFRWDGLSVYCPIDPAIGNVDALFPLYSADAADAPYRRVHPHYTPRSWFNIRCSKNESLIRLSVECRDGDSLRNVAQRVLGEITAACKSLQPTCSVQVLEWGALSEQAC